MLKCVDGSHHFPPPSCYTRFSHLTGRCSNGSHVDGRETKNNVKGTSSKAVKTGWWKRVRVITLSHVNVQTNHRKSYFFFGVIESSVFVARVFVFAQLLTSLCTLPYPLTIFTDPHFVLPVWLQPPELRCSSRHEHKEHIWDWFVMSV